jgi:hypothetical protein
LRELVAEILFWAKPNKASLLVKTLVSLVTYTFILWLSGLLIHPMNCLSFDVIFAYTVLKLNSNIVVLTKGKMYLNRIFKQSKIPKHKEF